MFSRKKKTVPTKRKDRPTPNLGFDFGIPGVVNSHEDNDSDLEAELFALTGEKSTNDDFNLGGGSDDDDLEAELARIIGKGSKHENILPTKLEKPSLSCNDSEEETDDIDENDPELLSELTMLTAADTKETEILEEANDDVKETKKEVSQVELIEQRLALYKTAELKAKSSNESSRARRFNRGIKTLEQLYKKAQRGEFVPYNEIPPEIATNLKPEEPRGDPSIALDPLPTSSTDAPGASENGNTEHENLATGAVLEPAYPTQSVQDEEKEKETCSQNDSRDKNNSHEVKRGSDSNHYDETNHPNIIPQQKRSDPLLTLLTERRDDFRKLALDAKKSGDINSALEHVRASKVCEQLSKMHESGNVINEGDIPQIPSKSKKKSNKTPEAIQRSATSAAPFLPNEVFTSPNTVKEALDQRLNYYIKALRKTESMGLRNETRKLESIVKIYQNAIKLHSRGGDVPYQKLPTPPGCPPIPLTFNLS